MANRIRDIIQVALAERGITRYRLTSLLTQGWQLPGRAYYGETETESGIVVTLDHVYRFWASWANDHYTLGEEDNSWRELTPDQDVEEDWSDITQIQQHMQAAPTFGAHESLPLPIREQSGITGRESLLLWFWLAPRFFNDYDLVEYDGPSFETFEVRSGGHDLVGSLLPGEVQDIEGIVVTHRGAYHFQLSWVWGPEDNPHHNPGHYSLGEKTGAWRPALQAEFTPEQWQQFQQAQQQLEQTFAQLPRADQPRWRDLAEDDAQPPRPPRSNRSPSEGKPRVPRDLSKNKREEDNQENLEDNQENL